MVLGKKVAIFDWERGRAENALIYNKNLLSKSIIQQTTKVDVLKFQRLAASQKGLDKQYRPRSDCF